ncbi:MAG: hypothetical protein AAF288_00095 [Planctomycetota bacterium]
MVAPESTPPGLSISDVVWGESYTRAFADWVLPTRLSPGNFGALQGRSADRYTIYTTRADRRRVEQSDAYPRLSELIDVRFQEIDGWIDADRLRADPNERYALLTRCHVHAVDDARRDRSAMVFLHPDAVWSDGTFALLLDLLRQGKRAVLQPGLRVAQEGFGPVFLKAFPCDDRGARVADARTLVRLAVRHLHKISRDSRWNANPMIDHPAHLYFPVGASGRAGLVARCFHLHPLMIWPVHWKTHIPTTIDGPFLRACCPDLQDLHVIDDSDDSIVLEISDASMRYPASIPRKGRLDAVAAWAGASIDSHHRAYFERAIRLHADDLDARWTSVEQQAEQVARDVLARLRWLPVAKVRSRVQSVGVMRSLGVRTRLRAAAGTGRQLVLGGGVRPHHLHHPRGPWQFARAKWWTVREQGAPHVARRVVRMGTGKKPRPASTTP